MEVYEKLDRAALDDQFGSLGTSHHLAVNFNRKLEIHIRQLA